MTGKGLQRVTSRVRYVKDPDKPHPPGTHNEEGEVMLCCFREEEEKTRGARKNLFIYESRFCLLTILMDSQVSKSYVLKQRFLILFLASPCSAHALHLSLSHSDRQISSNKLFQLYTYFHIAMRSVIHGRACGCVE